MNPDENMGIGGRAAAVTQAGIRLLGKKSRFRLAELLDSLVSKQVWQCCEDTAQSQWSGVGHQVRETHEMKAGKAAALRCSVVRISTDPRRQDEMWLVIE